MLWLFSFFSAFSIRVSEGERQGRYAELLVQAFWRNEGNFLFLLLGCEVVGSKKCDALFLTTRPRSP